MGLYSLILSGGIAVGLVLASLSDDLGGVQAVFYSADIVFSVLSLTSGYLLYTQRQTENTLKQPDRVRETGHFSYLRG